MGRATQLLGVVPFRPSTLLLNVSPLPLPIYYSRATFFVHYHHSSPPNTNLRSKMTPLTSAIVTGTGTGTGTISMLVDYPVLSDICATLVSAAIARATLALWEFTANYNIFDSKLNRKLVHTSIGLVFMICWPLFSSGHRGAILAGLVPGINAIRVLLIGLAVYQDEATVKSMSRYGDRRELLRGPLYYASFMSLACMIFWRTSPVGIAAICNLCAGDGLADIVGRRLGKHKLPYNEDKSYAGSIAMIISGFVTSVVFMHYFSLFGFLQESWDLVPRFLLVSIVSALVESLPLSTQLDDNLTVPLSSILAGTLIF